MNAALEFVSGRCTNDLFCAVASAGDIVRVPLGARFVCSYCGGKLEETSAQPRRIGLRGGAIIGGSMAVTGIALFAIGFWIGNVPAQPAAAAITSQVQPRPPSLPLAMPQQANDVTSPTPVRAAMATQPLAPPTLTMAPHPERVASAPPPVAVSRAIAEQPIPQTVQEVAHLTAPRARAELVVPRDPEPAREDAPKAAAAAPSSVAPHAVAASPVQDAAPSEADQLNAKEALNVAKPAPVAAPVVATKEPAPAGPSHAFVPQPVTGGAPVYPAAYEGGDRKGAVTVSCRIETSGAPTGCHVVRATGGEAFVAEINSWLDSGHVRFAPILHNGQAVSETHKWTVEFQPQSGS